jgi:hypothetical protein
MTDKQVGAILAAFAIVVSILTGCNDTCETVNVGTVTEPEYVCIGELEE